MVLVPVALFGVLHLVPAVTGFLPIAGCDPCDDVTPTARVVSGVVGGAVLATSLVAMRRCLAYMRGDTPPRAVFHGFGFVLLAIVGSAAVIAVYLSTK